MTDYAARIIPEPVRILGLSLRPFSLGHYFLLKRWECSFVAEEKSTASREDLILGVLICSMDFEGFQEFMRRKDLESQIRLWGRKVGLFDFKEKSGLFEDYLKKGTEQPAYWIEDDNGDSAGGHWSQALLLTLLSLGFSRAEALNMPLTQAFADFYKHAESMGSVQLMTAEEERDLEIEETMAEAGAADGDRPRSGGGDCGA